MDTMTLLRVFGGFASLVIPRLFTNGSCIASTAITLDVLEHYDRLASPWEVCLHVVRLPYHLEVGCHPPESSDGVGGHLVALVEDSFLVDASLRQVTDTNPALRVPHVFVGELMPKGTSLRDVYDFSIAGAALRYEGRAMSTDYRTSSDWGPSQEREAAGNAIVQRIDGYCQLHNLD